MYTPYKTTVVCEPKRKRVLGAVVVYLKNASFLLLLAQLFGACDSSGLTETRSLTPQPEVTLANGTISFRMDSNSYLRSNEWFVDPDDLKRFVSPFASAGLWLAADQDGPRSNTAVPLVKTNGFDMDEKTVGASGVFLINRDSLETRISNWPIELGAPSDPDGQPLLSGDVMAWGAFLPAPTYDAARSLQGLRIGMTANLYSRVDLSSAIFVRYDITNTREEAIHGLFVGFGADTDLVMVYDGVQECGLGWWDNQTGYDSDRRLSFAYTSRHPQDGDLPDHCYGLVAGYSILDMSVPGGLGGEILAHRIRTRDRFRFYPEYSDRDLEAGQGVLNALQGLSPAGESMIDPSTGQSTKIAFSGDPIAGTGWIGERDDVRSLLSLPPVDLAPGETRSLTILWVFAFGADLQEGISLLKSRFDAIAAQRELWDY